MENTKLVLNADEKAVVERELNLAYGSMSTLLDWVKTDKLTEEMKESLPSIVDSCMNSVKTAIGYTGKESERSKEMSESIGQYYQRQINDLEKALSSQNSIGSLAANTKLVFDKIDKWWDIEGFNYTSDKNIAESGMVNISLGFMLNSFANRYSATPVTDKAEAQTKVQYLEDKGFEFTPRDNGHDLDLLDNDANRKRLDQLVKSAFPSAKIWSFTNRLRRTNNEADDHFIIRSIDVSIFDLSDVEALVIEEKEFLLEED